jgi:His/Glu/Gln/Arg/opine family amino acid ABC transporter permease subunit
MSVYTYVETTPPETRKPPVTEIGALGWMRKNLFGTWYDAVLTISFGVLIVYAAIGLANWIVGTAQWDVIVNNLRLFGSGRYPPDQAWRAGVAALIVAALAGISWGLWGRLLRSTAMLLGAGLVILLILPVVGGLFPIPPIYALVSAASSEPPPPLIFVGGQGQALRLTLTPVTRATETPKGFIGTASRTAWGEFRRATTEQGPADLAATVRLQDGRLDTLGTVRVQADGEAETIEVSLPTAGWYVLLLEGEGTAGAAWLEIEGVEPMSSLGSAQQEYAQTYGSPPEIAGTRVRALDNAWLRFVGTRTLGDFLALHVGPGAAAVSGVALAVGVCVAVGYGLGQVARRREKLARRVVVAAWALSFPVVLLVLRGLDNAEALPYVGTERWGGLVLTLVLAVVGIVAAFPIGVLAALGRRSSLPMVRIFCTLYIEFVRGVPLVTVLWSANVMVPLMEPRLANVDSVIRAMVGMTLFTGAYLAENVRGGLQAIPHGQVEAARAVGMNAFLVTTLVVLPQALRAVIPAIAGLFIALFKDTSLVIIIGLLELLGIARSVISQPEYVGLQREAFVFIAVIYFVFSYAMSYTSRRLEETGSGAVRKL